MTFLDINFLILIVKTKSEGEWGCILRTIFNFKIREDLSTPKEDIVESLFIEFKTNDKADPIVVGVLYRP